MMNNTKKDLIVMKKPLQSKPVEKFYPVYKVNGVTLYAKEPIRLCECYGGLHIEGIGCD
jgi:hypothetical protein